jgi:hypothetical protein
MEGISKVMMRLDIAVGSSRHGWGEDNYIDWMKSAQSKDDESILHAWEKCHDVGDQDEGS